MTDKKDNKKVNAEKTNGEILHVKFVPELFKGWYLDYASYVILERAVPEILDGLKPVQRRILHTMKRLDDGRYNKVANIIGFTMQYHPHGDASIGDALVSMGQKDLLIDTQGNWGNLLTGDKSAAPRYIEARLSEFAKDVMFNPKVTEWKLSYDGRNKEPVCLPTKFPVLVASGSEGIAVGLASKILPHNFNEIIDSSVAYLKNENFTLLPDFPTGGMADFSKYNDGLQGGRVKVRAKISKTDNRTLSISEIPFGKTSESLIDSILSANDKGKIRIKKIDDNTSDKIEIVITLHPGSSPDKVIDALYAFSDCEVSIAPNCCVIQDKKPVFIGITELLKVSVNNTVRILEKELKIRKSELEELWHMSSLEKIFIENRIYNLIEECETWESVLYTIEQGLEPFKHRLKREINYDDIVKLTEIKIKRISKYNSFKADEYIKKLEKELEETIINLKNIISYTIAFYKDLKEKYGKGRERRTEIKSFEIIEAAKVAEANKKLYVNKKDGFFGFSLRDGEFVDECSDIDDVIIFLKDGSYLIKKVADKSFAGKDIIHIAIFKKNDSRTIYNLVYRDGKDGYNYVKRFAVKSVTRDKTYVVTKGTPGSSVLYLTSNPNGEAEKIRVYHAPKKRLRKTRFDFDFSTIDIKGRASNGNILSRNKISRIVMTDSGVSTIGGIELWFDHNLKRLNDEGRGQPLGEFAGDDQIVEITGSGNYKTYNYDMSNHFENDLIYIHKFNEKQVITVVYYEGESEYFYLKRFISNLSSKKISITGENDKSHILAVSDLINPVIELKLRDKRGKEKTEVLEISKFIGIKSLKAKGKRVSNLDVISAEFKKKKLNDKLETGNETEFEEPLQKELFK